MAILVQISKLVSVTKNLAFIASKFKYLKNIISPCECFLGLTFYSYFKQITFNLYFFLDSNNFSIKTRVDTDMFFLTNVYHFCSNLCKKNPLVISKSKKLSRSA